MLIRILLISIFFLTAHFVIICAAPKNVLALFYSNSFNKAERETALKAIKTILPDYNFQELELASEEVLATHHLVYHETRWHRMQDNVSLVRQYEDEIQRVCSRYGVPAPIAFAVLTWENSGGIGKRSYTGNIGLGQLGAGAVSLSHAYSAKISLNLREKAREHYRKAKETGSKEEYNKALLLQKKAREYDLSAKHRQLAKQFHLNDERGIPLANIEDAVVFLKILLNAYAGRPDLAIAAYHNGMQNMDDILSVYLKRKGLEFTPELIRTERITYLSLWRDQHIREIMSGLRAMSGKIASKDNGFDTLFDESDLYLWKIIAAYGAYKADDAVLTSLLDRYSNRKDQSDTNGLISYITENDIKNGINNKGLMVSDNITAHPAVFGLLNKLGIRNKKDVQILGVLSSANNISFDSIEEERAENVVHARGLSVDIDITNYKNKDQIRKALKWWYHFDRIYLTRLPVKDKMMYHISINPRFAHLFEKFAVKK